MTRLSSYLPFQLDSPLFSVLKHPPVLASLLRYLAWPDLHALLCSSQSARSLFRSPPLRSLILSRHVPEYRAAIACSDPSQDHNIPVSIHDLDLLLISQKLALHHYPTHALRTLSSLLPGLDHDELTSRLSALALAHSRFVLLLQSLVHSSTAPLRPELPDPFSKPHLRELSFPAPLSYSTSPQKPPGPTRLTQKPLPVVPPARRLSLFRKSHTRTPPPPSEPRALAHYSSSWRRSLFHHRAHSSIGSGSGSDSDFTPPHRRHVSSPTRTSSSSPSPRSTPQSTAPSSPEPAFSSPAPAPSPASPHSLFLATSRTRAPLLRVYAPSTTLNPTQCEDQLISAALWQHLSTGDVVCNLGHVPEHLAGPASPWLIFDGTALVPYAPLSTQYPDTVPVPTPLALPSPFYYSHIAPPTPLANPVFRIPRIPAPRSAPRLALTHLPTKVPSPHSPAGYAVARKHVWTARVRVDGLGHVDGVMDIGGAWKGEWVLEGDGTREGRQGLLACLAGDSMYWGREWEFVRERSGRGRVWLRLLEVRD